MSTVKRVLMNDENGTPVVPWVPPASATTPGVVKVDGTTLEVNDGVISAKANAAEKVSKSGDTMSGTLNMGSQKVTNVANGTDSGDAVNKGQLDGKVSKSGDTMTGSLTMNNGGHPIITANNLDFDPDNPPSANVYGTEISFRDKQAKVSNLGYISSQWDSNGQLHTRMGVNRKDSSGNSHFAQIDIGVDANNVSRGYCPTPPSSDNTTSIATTAWVRSMLANITALSATSGTVSLADNTIYSMSITGDTTFSLPTPSDTTKFHQIKVIAAVTGTPAITWGTTKFFNKETPSIEAGNYDFYFDYDPKLGAWVAGAIAKGA